MALLNRIVPHMTRDLESSFERAFQEPFFRLSAPSTSRLITGPFMNRPAVDLKENKNSFIIEAELPGVTKQDVSVEFSDNNTLTLKGKIGASTSTNVTSGAGASAEEKASGSEQQQQSVVEPEWAFWNQERMMGNFQRSFTFPTAMDTSKVDASLKDGVLTVTVQKTEPKSNRIEIKQLE